MSSTERVEAQWQALLLPYASCCSMYAECSPEVRAMLLPGLTERYNTLLQFTAKHSEYKKQLPKAPQQLRNFIFFWNNRQPDIANILRVHHVREFRDDADGLLYQNIYQYVVRAKAIAFGDNETAAAIMNDSNMLKTAVTRCINEPAFYQRLHVTKSGMESAWMMQCRDVVSRAYYLKFSQHSDLRQKLLNTAGAIIAATSARDKLWGIGLTAAAAELCECSSEWPGRNWLGECIMSVRKELRCWAPKPNRTVNDQEEIEIEVESDKEEETRENGTPTEHINVWTDGACSKNGREDAVAGIGVFFGDGDARNISERYAPNENGLRATNQTAELAAAIRALEICLQQRDVKHITLHTDSEYVIKCSTSWIHRWKKNGWKTSKGQPVQNQPLVKRLWQLAFDHGRGDVSIEFKHVKGHSGDYGNSQADALATAAYK